MKPGGGGYGQNLAMWGSSNKEAAFAVGPENSVSRAVSNGWYNGEIELFPSADYGKDSPDLSNFEDWGHYSQVVWKNTQEVGCAAHFCPIGTMNDRMSVWFTVCDYYPAGNIRGYYGANVLPPLGQPVVIAD